MRTIRRLSRDLETDVTAFDALRGLGCPIPDIPARPGLSWVITLNPILVDLAYVFGNTYGKIT